MSWSSAVIVQKTARMKQPLLPEPNASKVTLLKLQSLTESDSRSLDVVWVGTNLSNFVWIEAPLLIYRDD